MALDILVCGRRGLGLSFQQGLDIAIEGEKPEEVEEKEWSIINRLACGTIRSCLSREQKYVVKNETSTSTKR